MAKKWHKKHVPTQWGVAILGFLLVSMVLLIPVLGQRQDLRSDAASYGTCKTPAGKGICQNRNTTACSGYYNSGNYCPGASNIQCCLPAKSCTGIKGTCQNAWGAHAKSCAGYYDSGNHCPGPDDVQCCVTSIPNSSACKAKGGVCEKKVSSKSGGKYHPEYLCPGPANIQCWVKGSTTTKPPVVVAPPKTPPACPVFIGPVASGKPTVACAKLNFLGGCPDGGTRMSGYTCSTVGTGCCQTKPLTVPKVSCVPTTTHVCSGL